LNYFALLPNGVSMTIRSVMTLLLFCLASSAPTCMPMESPSMLLSSHEIPAVFEGEAAVTEVGLSLIKQSFWDVHECITSNDPLECANETMIIVFVDSVNDPSLREFDKLADRAGPFQHVGAFQSARQLEIKFDEGGMKPTFYIAFNEGAFLLYPYLQPPSAAFIADLFIQPCR
jgi:hypothetical protein